MGSALVYDMGNPFDEVEGGYRGFDGEVVDNGLEER